MASGSGGGPQSIESPRLVLHRCDLSLKKKEHFTDYVSSLETSMEEPSSDLERRVIRPGYLREWDDESAWRDLMLSGSELEQGSEWAATIIRAETLFRGEWDRLEATKAKQLEEHAWSGNPLSHPMNPIAWPTVPSKTKERLQKLAETARQLQSHIGSLDKTAKLQSVDAKLQSVDGIFNATTDLGQISAYLLEPRRRRAAGTQEFTFAEFCKQRSGTDVANLTAVQSTQLETIWNTEFQQVPESGQAFSKTVQQSCKATDVNISTEHGTEGNQCVSLHGGDRINVSPALWGITLPEVKDFWTWVTNHPLFKSGMSVRQMVDDVLKAPGPLPNGYPETFASSSGRSVALSKLGLTKNKPSQIRWLVSHCWEEDFLEFFEDLFFLLDKQMKVPNDDGIFVCFLCIFQGTDKEIEMQVTQSSSDIFQGCFTQILRSVKDTRGALCIIPNENLRKEGFGIYSRLWCGWEADQAKKNRVKILLHPKRSAPDYLFNEGDLTMSLYQGSCGPPASAQKPRSQIDKDNESRIRRAIGESWEEIDQTLKLICSLQS